MKHILFLFLSLLPFLAWAQIPTVDPVGTFYSTNEDGEEPFHAVASFLPQKEEQQGKQGNRGKADDNPNEVFGEEKLHADWQLLAGQEALVVVDD